MTLTTTPLGERLLVTLEARRLDAAAAPDFKAGMIALIDRGATAVVLDLGKVEFMDSSGLGALVGVLKHLGRSGSLELARLTGGVEKVFALTRMNSVFRIHTDLPAA